MRWTPWAINQNWWADMLKGRVEFNKDALTDAAELFSEHGSMMIELFRNTEESQKANK